MTWLSRLREELKTLSKAHKPKATILLQSTMKTFWGNELWFPDTGCGRARTDFWSQSQHQVDFLRELAEHSDYLQLQLPVPAKQMNCCCLGARLRGRTLQQGGAL